MNPVPTVPERICFSVAEVTPSTKRLATVRLRVSLEALLDSPLLICPNANDDLVQGTDFHPLIAAAVLAFKEHYPLVLSPDMIWLTVLQGVAQHIQNHAERLRGRLVGHQTKIELVLDTDLIGVPANDDEMVEVGKRFIELIARHIQPRQRFILDTEFSTTTPIERIANCVVLMEGFQRYFDYAFYCVCGIPSIILEGTPADWELLKSRVEQLDESDLDLSWWTRHLVPLCNQFVRVARGDVDREHWKDLCKLTQRYGREDLNGWLLKFIPYVRSRKKEIPTRRNPVLELSRFSEDSDDEFKITGCTSDMLPLGIASAPVACVNKQTGEANEVRFVAGFTGVTQSSQDLALRPRIGWAISETRAIDRMLQHLRVNYGAVAPRQVDLTKELIDRMGFCPGNMARFYSEVDGATIRFPTGLECRLLRWSELGRCCDEAALLTDSAPIFFQTRRALQGYAALIRIAEVSDGTWYLFGPDPEEYGRQPSRGEIFFWTGEPNMKAFVPVARNFTEWLEQILRFKLPRERCL